jgi:uncharacterized membrane protein
MAGLFFVFSNFAMRALAQLPANYGCAAMQAINVKIINPWFLALFLGTGICSLLSLALAALNMNKPASTWIISGSLLYLVGCLVITFACNVPLNNKLAAIDPEHPGSPAQWQEYVDQWTPWNHVRTIATLAATTAFIIAVIPRS